MQNLFNELLDEYRRQGLHFLNIRRPSSFTTPTTVRSTIGMMMWCARSTRS